MSDPVKLKILILDPDKDFLKAMSETAPCNEDADVVAESYNSKTKEQLEEKILAQYPDIVVINLDQDKLLDFASSIQVIRNIPIASPPVIIGTTTNEAYDLKQQAYLMGIDDYLLKPFKKEELWFRLRVAMRTRRLQKQLDSATRKLSGLNLTLAETNRRLEELSVTDELTGLYNMRFMTSYLEKQFILLRRHPRPFAIVMIDLDHFKSVNDSNDHLVGSASIKRMGELIDESTRKSDIKARYGGDEYIIAMPETAAKDAWEVADRLRQRLSKTALVGSEGEEFFITASLGVAGFDVDKHHRYTDLVKQADRALYHAKEGGRNRVLVFNDSMNSNTYDEKQSSVLTAIEKTKPSQ